MSFVKDFIQEESARSPEFRAAYEAELAAEAKAAELMAALVMIRNRKRLSQRAVAARMGLSQPRIAQIERMKSGVSTQTIVAYAQAVGATIKVEDTSA